MKKEPLRFQLKKQSMRFLAVSLAGALLLPLSGLPSAFTAAAASPSDVVSVKLNGNDIRTDSVNGLTFKGFGLLSGNSTSALLMDYKSEQPAAYAQMLRVLFGGSSPIMTNVKVEMGNDRNTSTGAETCTQRTADEPADAAREPGFQLAADAKKINPNIKVTILRWEAPGWVKSNDDIYTWYKNTILSAYRTYGYMVDYVNPGVNESKSDLTWLQTYAARVKSDSTGFDSPAEQQLYNNIKVVASDEVGTASCGSSLVSDANLRSLVPIVGWHYSTDDDSAGNFKNLADNYDEEIWNSEAQATFSNSAYRPYNNTKDPSVAGTGIGGTGSALEMANTIVKGFVNSRRTNFIYQPAIGAFYEGGQYSSKGLVLASDPWSGWIHYDAALDILRQFSEFGDFGWENSTNTAGIWRAVASASQTTASGTNPVNGRNGLANYITLAAPDKTNFSTVIVNDSEYTKSYQISASNMRFSGTPKLAMWETRAADDTTEAFNSNYLKHIGDVTADASGVYAVTVKPYSIMTVTTLDKSDDDPSLQQLPVEGDRTVLDTDANGDGHDTADTTLYADNYEKYAGKTVPVINSDGTLSAAQTEPFIASRGGDTSFAPLYMWNMNGAFEGYKTASGNYILRQQVDTNAAAPGGAWNGGDPVAGIGDNRWLNYKASIDVSFEDAGTYNGANYASLGVRQQTGNSGGAPYYLKFWQDGGWQLYSNGTSVATGNVATGSGGTTIAGFDTGSSAWHNIAVQAAGDTITAYIDNTQVASYSDSAIPELSGRVTIGSGFYYTDFDNFKVETVKGYTPYYSEQLDDLQMYDLSSPPKQELVYGGSWSHSNGQGMYIRDRSVSVSTAVGATLSYTFTGTGFDICGDDDGSAKLDVTVDGTLVAKNAPTLDASTLYQAYTLRGLSYGQHTVQVKVVSGTLNVDYVGVVSGLASGNGAVDVSALKAKVDAGKLLNSADYNPATWAVFDASLEPAEAALSDPAAYRLDQEGADALAARLQAAQDGLVAADVSSDTVALGLLGVATKQGALPAAVQVEGKSVGIQWDAGSANTVVSAPAYSAVTLSGRTTDKLSDGYYHPVTVQLEVVPADLKYYIDSGASDTAADYAGIAANASLQNNHADQVYTAGGWGYVNDGINIKSTTSANDKYATGLWAGSGKNIVYKLPLDAGTYQLTAGFAEWWGQTRPMSQTVTYTEDGVTKSVSGDNISLSSTATQATGTVTFTLKQAQTITYTVAKTGSSDPVISWLSVAAVHSDPIFTSNAANNYAGLLLNGGAAVKNDLAKGSALTLDGKTGSYAQFDPDKVTFDGRDSMTITMDFKTETDNSGNFFTYALGQDSNKYLFLRTRSQNIYTAITTGSYGAESKVNYNPPSSIKDQWDNVAIVVKPGSITTYLDGTAVGTASTGALVSNFGANVLSYLGKSFYSGDAYFNGSFANINVYDHALSAAEIAQSAAGQATQSLQTAVDSAQALHDAAVAGDHEGNYPQSAVAALQTAIDSANTVLGKIDATTADKNAAVSVLGTAVAAFQGAVVTVDRTQLSALVASASALDSTHYTKGSWAAFAAARSAAQALLDGKPSQQELDAAVQTLTGAENGLADLSALQALYDANKDKPNDFYTDASWAAFTDALEGAQSVLGDDSAAQQAVDAAAQALADAVGGLTKKPVNKTVLQALYDANKDKPDDFYTDASWAAFQTALQAARDTLGLTDAGQEAVDAAAQALADAVNGLVTKPADKTALQAAYDANKDKTNDDYTDASWAAFTDALDNAQYLLGSDTAAQAEVDAAAQALAQAADGLVKKPSAAPIQRSDPATGVQIEIPAGVVPAGVTLTVTPVRAGDALVRAQQALAGIGSRLAVYDISLTLDGVEIEPDGAVQVSLPIPYGFDASRVAVFRINGDGTRTQMDGHVENGAYVFETGHFSTYALVETDAAPSAAPSASSAADTGSTGNPETGNPEAAFPASLAVLVVLMGGAAAFAFRRRSRRN